MLPDTYFKRNGVIYGDRSHYNGNGIWYHEFVRFTNLKKAMEWKAEGKKDFSFNRELLSKNELKLRGAKFDDNGKIID